jgi:hypothetical protein
MSDCINYVEMNGSAITKTCARQPHTDWYLMRKTYLCLFANVTKKFDDWFDSKYWTKEKTKGNFF